jgi:hypothetical protein
VDDPDGAITSARTLLETACKHILDAAGVAYEESLDLPKLYWLTVGQMGLAVGQHPEPTTLRLVLGGCTVAISGIGAMLDEFGDSRGKGQSSAKPEAPLGELAVNLAGALALFLVQSWEDRCA